MKSISGEMAEIQREIASQTELIEPTEEEKKAGWDAESLTAYVVERNAAATLKISVNSMYRSKKLIEQNSRYNPHRWRA